MHRCKPSFWFTDLKKKKIFSNGGGGGGGGGGGEVRGDYINLNKFSILQITFFKQKTSLTKK